MEFKQLMSKKIIIIGSGNSGSGAVLIIWHVGIKIFHY